MRRNRKSTILLLLGVLVLGLTLGYAYLNTTLNIDGVVNVSSANWNVYWDNIQLGTNNVTTVTTPATISTGKTEVSFNVNFSLPGDTYEFTVDAVNDGSIDAMIDTVTTGVYAANGVTQKEMPDYLDFTVTYSDDVELAQNHILRAGTRETYKVRVHYKEDITASQLPSTADNYMFKFGVNYIQKSSAGIPKPAPPFSYTISNTFNYIGQALPSVTVYNNYQDAVTAFGYNFFLRHKLTNNIITESYVGFVLNNQDYYLKGGDGGDSYETNKETLLSAFGSSNCQVDRSCGLGEDCQYTECTMSTLSARAYSNGRVYASTGGRECCVYGGGSSHCGDNLS